MSVKINSEELDILFGHDGDISKPCGSRISPRAKIVYFYLRQFMDYKTGLIGFKRVVSYQSIREAIEYNPPQGSKNQAERPTDRAIMSVLSELERTGLIKWIKNKARGLFFECLLADKDNFAQKDERNLNVGKERNLKSEEKQGFNDAFIGEERNQDFEKNVTPPKSVINTATTTSEVDFFKSTESPFDALTINQLKTYFVNHHGYSFGEIHNSAVITTFHKWIKAGITFEQVRRGVEQTLERFAQKGKAKPSIAYFAGAVTDYANAEKQQAQKSQRVNSTNNAGSLDTNSTKKSAGNNYDTGTAKKSRQPNDTSHFGNLDYYRQFQSV